MTARPRDRLYALLPAAYRAKDQARGEPLRALLAVMERELAAIEQDVDGLYRNWFVETCDEWATPYIGDLLGVRGLHVERDGLPSQRAFVANTLWRRRRKGTAAMLERAIRDLTGWDARVVPLRERLLLSQHANHPRHGFDPRARGADPATFRTGGSVDLRDPSVCRALEGPFDASCRTPDLRAGAGGARPGLGAAAIFLWRLASNRLADVDCAPVPAEEDAPPGAWRLDPLGLDAPLFSDPRRRQADPASRSELGVAAPIDPRAFASSLARGADDAAPGPRYYGPGLSLALRARAREGSPWEDVPAARILARDLARWTPPPPGRVAVDVALGRVLFAPGEAPAALRADLCQGAAGDVGGGPYARPPPPEARVVRVARSVPTDAEGEWSASVDEAVGAAWVLKPGDALAVVVEDSGTHPVAGSWALPPGVDVQVHAAPLERPVLRPEGGVLHVEGGPGSSLALHGVVLDGGLDLRPGGLGALRLVDATLRPGRALVSRGAAALRSIRLERAIAGSLRVEAEQHALAAADSILDGAPAGPSAPGEPHAIRGLRAGEDGPAALLERCTVFGAAGVVELSASDCLFVGPVRVRRRQTGFARRCHFAGGSLTPSREQCFPTAEAPALAPTFTSRSYGHPAYGQLGRACPRELLAASERGSELGAFSRLRQATREEALLAAMEEMLPVGLDPVLVYVT